MPSRLFACAAISISIAAGASARQDQPSTAPPSPQQSPLPQPAEPEHSHPLGVGDLAPPIAIEQWLRGDPLKELTPGPVYIVEFWATWCGPCRRSLETLSALQGARDPAKLIVIGVCGPDSHGETADRIVSFVAARRDRLRQRIALDDDDTTRIAWLGGARIMQIPAALVVSPDGRIAWIGNPARSAPAMTKVVDELLAGTFSFEKAIALAKTEATRRAQIEEKAVELQVVLRTAMQESDYETVCTVIDALIRLDPDRYSRLSVARFGALMTGLNRPDAALDYARELLADRLRDDAMGLQALAWAILESSTTSKTRDLALEIATQANQLVEDDPTILDTLARAQFDRGEIDSAIATQLKAVEKALSSKMKELLTQTLSKYQAAKKR